MNPNQSALWMQLESFTFGTGQEARSFTHRLAQENNWSYAYAQRVVLEYKKFVFLCMTSGQVCTPSIAVDEAWHLHLTYTKSYWEDLRAILPRPLHHNPTAGGEEQDNYFEERYNATLATYESVFGTVPPRDIWPPAQERFAPVNQPVKVVPANAIVIPRIKANQWLRRATLAGTVPAVALPVSQVGLSNPTLLTFFIVGGLFLIGSIIWLVRRFGQNGGTGSSGCGDAGAFSSGCNTWIPTSTDSSSGDAGGSGDSGGSGCSSGCSGGGCGGGGCGS